MRKAGPQMSAARCLRPYRRFEYDYSRVGGSPQTVSGAVPILFSYPANPQDVNPPTTYDNYAYDSASRENIPGFSPRLAALSSIPLGASVCFFLPIVSSAGSEFVYIWRPVFRLRNMGDYRRQKKNWTIGREGQGSASTLVGDTGDRYVLLASGIGSVYVRPEPAVLGVGQTAMGAQYMYPEGIVIPATGSSGSMFLQDSLRPGGDPAAPVDHVILQQGLLNPGDGRVNAGPFLPHWFKASGDEFGLYCYKYEYKTSNDVAQLVPRNWDFRYDPATGFCNAAAEDYPFSVLFGVGIDVTPSPNGPYPNMGVYATWGETGI